MNEKNRIEKYLEWMRVELDTLEADFRRASEVQWQRAPSARPDTDEIKRKNIKPDPTADTALDPQRLAVREALSVVDRELLDVLRKMRSMSGRLRFARNKWEGPR